MRYQFLTQKLEWPQGHHKMSLSMIKRVGSFHPSMGWDPLTKPWTRPLSADVQIFIFDVLDAREASSAQRLPWTCWSERKCEAGFTLGASCVLCLQKAGLFQARYVAGLTMVPIV